MWRRELNAEGLAFYPTTKPISEAADQLHRPCIVLSNFLLNEFMMDPEFDELKGIARELGVVRLKLTAYLAEGKLTKALKARQVRLNKEAGLAQP